MITIDIKPEHKKSFIEESVADAQGSVENEPGCLRFDVLQDDENPNRIYLYEVYRDDAAVEAPFPNAPFTSMEQYRQGLLVRQADDRDHLYQHLSDRRCLAVGFAPVDNQEFCSTISEHNPGLNASYRRWHASAMTVNPHYRRRQR